MSLCVGYKNFPCDCEYCQRYGKLLIQSVLGDTECRKSREQLNADFNRAKDCIKEE